MTKVAIDNRMRKIERLIKIVCDIAHAKPNPARLNAVLGGLFDHHEELINARRKAR